MPASKSARLQLRIARPNFSRISLVWLQRCSRYSRQSQIGSGSALTSYIPRTACMPSSGSPSLGVCNLCGHGSHEELSIGLEFINTEETQSFFVELGLSQQTLFDAMRLSDLNGVGSVSHDEFVAALSSLMTPPRSCEIRELYQRVSLTERNVQKELTEIQGALSALAANQEAMMAAMGLAKPESSVKSHLQEVGGSASAGVASSSARVCT